MRYERMILKEGGNVFKDPETKQPVTQRIRRDDVDTTLAWVEKITGLPHRDFKLGSTGKKATSGDLDVAVDQNQVSKDELVAKLLAWKEKNHPDDADRQWVAKSGTNVHFKTPINGNPENGYVQTDLMFGDPKWMKFALKGSGDDTVYGGKHRMILIASIAKAQGMKWSPTQGLVDRESNQPISKDPDEIADKLLGPGANKNTLDSVESINAFIKTKPNYDQLVSDAKDFFEKEGLPMPESKGIFKGMKLAESKDLKFLGKIARGARDGIKSAKAGYAAGRAAFSPGGSVKDMAPAYGAAGGAKTTLGQVGDKVVKPAKDKIKKAFGYDDEPIAGRSGAEPVDGPKSSKGSIDMNAGASYIDKHNRKWIYIPNEDYWATFNNRREVIKTLPAKKGLRIFNMVKRQDPKKVLESKTKINEAKAKARIDHLEDLVIFEKSKGAVRALESLKSLQQGGHENVTLKWDGSPAVVFGRDENGEFIFTDKGGFIKKGGVGRAKSGDELKQELLNRSGGKDRDKPDRIEFADRMARTFDVYEKAVPKDYRGFLKGDLLYYTTPPLKDGYYVFKPQLVEYRVDAKSELGKKVGNSVSGIVIHREVNAEGAESALKENPLQGNSVMVFPPVQVQKAPEVDNEPIVRLAKIIQKDGAAIDKLLDESTLLQKKMKAFPDLLYRYTNSKVDTGLENMGKDFIKWLDSAPVTQTMKNKVTEYVKENIRAFRALWEVHTGIMNAKDTVIRNMDQQGDLPVKQYINGQPGGEGYVMTHPEGDVKYVNRKEFTAANRAVER